MPGTTGHWMRGPAMIIYGKNMRTHRERIRPKVDEDFIDEDMKRDTSGK